MQYFMNAISANSFMIWDILVLYRFGVKWGMWMYFGK